MRRVRETDIVSASVKRYTKTYRRFSAFFEDMKYRLALDPSLCEQMGVRLNSIDPPKYVIETAEMRPIGIPRIRFVVEVDTVITVSQLAVFELK